MTELTTGLTDALLALECILIVVLLWRPDTVDQWRRGLWCSVFGLTAFASLLGAIAHGLDMPEPTRAMIWKPLYLSLGIVVTLFVVGAIHDWLGGVWSRRFLPWGIAAGIAFFGLTELMGGDFLVFVLFEAVGMLLALAIYLYLLFLRRFPGAGVIALAILLSLMAAGVQASDLSANIVVPFDHNGLFHLVQIVSVAVLAYGLQIGPWKK